jgi:hypothetical protein
MSANLGDLDGMSMRRVFSKMIKSEEDHRLHKEESLTANPNRALQQAYTEQHMSTLTAGI